MGKRADLEIPISDEMKREIASWRVPATFSPMLLLVIQDKCPRCGKPIRKSDFKTKEDIEIFYEYGFLCPECYAWWRTEMDGFEKRTGCSWDILHRIPEKKK